jgi:hypothetical protein
MNQYIGWIAPQMARARKTRRIAASFNCEAKLDPPPPLSRSAAADDPHLGGAADADARRGNIRRRGNGRAIGPAGGKEDKEDKGKSRQKAHDDPHGE